MSQPTNIRAWPRTSSVFPGATGRYCCSPLTLADSCKTRAILRACHHHRKSRLDYLLEFHWWYLLVLFALWLALFGRHKGGLVVQRLTAELEVLDERFATCRTEATYSTFKPGTPDHIDIELDRLDLPTGDVLELQLNAQTLATVPVKRNREAEFDHWSDDGTEFPVIKTGDQLVVRYQGHRVLEGTFRADP